MSSPVGIAKLLEPIFKSIEAEISGPQSNGPCFGEDDTRNALPVFVIAYSACGQALFQCAHNIGSPGLVRARSCPQRFELGFPELVQEIPEARCIPSESRSSAVKY